MIAISDQLSHQTKAFPLKLMRQLSQSVRHWSGIGVVATAIPPPSTIAAVPCRSQRHGDKRFPIKIVIMAHWWLDHDKEENVEDEEEEEHGG